MSEDVKTSKAAKKQSITDVAKYEAKTAITPAASNINMSNVMLGAASNELALGAMADSIADNASSALAVINATEAAKTPGRTLAPGLTKATRSFNEIYTDEEYNNVLLQSQKLIRENESLVARNPTAENLQAFQKNTMAGVTSLVGQVSEGNKARLGRALEGAYSSAYQSLDEKVYAKNQEVIVKEFKGNLDQNLKDIGNKNYAGDRPAVEFTKKQALENIKNAEARESISHLEARNYETMVELEDEQTLSNYRAMIEEKAGNGEAHLKSLIETTPSDGDYVKRDTIALGTAKFLNQYRSIRSGAETLNYLQAQESLRTGTLSVEQMEALNPQNQARIRLEQIGMDTQKASAVSQIRTLDASFGDPSSVSELSPKQVDSAAHEKWNQAQAARGGEPLTLGEKAAAVQEWAVNVPSLSKQIASTAKLGAPEQATAALDTYLAMRNNGRPAVSGADSDIRELAEAYSDLRTSLPAEEALMAAKDQTLPLTSDQKKQRFEDYSSQRNSTHGWNNYSTKTKEIAEEMGYKKGVFRTTDRSQIPEGMVSKFEKIQQASFMKGSTWDQSMKIAATEMKKISGPTGMNGISGEQTLFPPEKYVPGGSSSTPWMRNQMVVQSQQTFERLRDLISSGNTDIGYFFESPEGSLNKVSNPDTQEMVPSTWIGNEPYKVSKVYQDGSRVEGEVIIQWDQATIQPPAGELPSYSLWFKGPNGNEAIPDGQTGRTARWRPDVKKAQSELPQGQSLQGNMLQEQLKEQRREEIRATISPEVLQEKARAAKEKHAQGKQAFGSFVDDLSKGDWVGD